MMRIFLITAEGYECRYVANKLSEIFDLGLIIVDRGKDRSMYSRMHQLLKRYSVPQFCSKLIEKVMHIILRDTHKKQRAMINILGEDMCLNFKDPEKIVYVKGINMPSSIEIVKNYSPDLILIYGTGIIGRRIMEIPTKGILNMHTGMSPIYRGTGGVFWPIYDGKPEYIGATVHECTPIVDGGRIYGTIKANLEADDNIYSLFPRVVLVGTELYIDIVKKIIDGKLEGQKQDLSIGKEYRSAMKRWWHEIIVNKKIRQGVICDYVGMHPQNKQLDHLDEKQSL